MNKQIKYLRAFASICVLGLLYSSCVKKANYPDIPQITYNGFIPFCDNITTGQTDSAYLRVNFTDGNGDIGNPQQLGAPNDFFAVPLLYVYATNSFQPIINPANGDTVMFSYNIPDITPTGSDKELNGIIQANLEDFIQQYITESGLGGEANVHELQFKIWLFDRAGNKSNVLLTPIVYTCH